MSCQAQGNSAYVLDIIAGMSDWGRKLQNDCSSLLSTHTCYSPMVRRYNVSLWACRHSWEPAFDFCQCLIKIMLMLLILTIKLWLCKTKQKEKKKFNTVLSILFIYHFPSPLNRQWWEMSASKLSVAVLQIYWWGLKFNVCKNTCAFLSSPQPRFFQISAYWSWSSPNPQKHCGSKVLKYLCMLCQAFQTISVLLPILYRDCNSLLSWWAEVMLLCEELDRNSPGMGFDK